MDGENSTSGSANGNADVSQASNNPHSEVHTSTSHSGGSLSYQCSKKEDDEPPEERPSVSLKRR